MKARFLILLLVLMLYAGAVSASVYSSFPYNLEQRSDELSTEIELGVVNTGGETLSLDFTAPGSNAYNVSLPENTLLQPTEIETDPEGEDWQYLGNDRYAKITRYSFEVDISRYRDSNRIDIPLQITASPTGETEGSASNAILQSMTHNYTILLSPQLRPVERETEQEKEVYWEQTGEDSLPDEWSEETGSESSEESKDYKANETDENTGERGSEGINTVTMILLLAIIACSGYILRVV